MTNRLTLLRTKTDKLYKKYEHYADVSANLQKRLKQNKKHIKSIEEAQTIIQNVAQIIQQKAHKHLSIVVNRCLEAVFDEPYEFKILFEKKRGQTEAKLAFFKGDKEVNPMRCGGQLDVAAFALRLGVLLLRKPAVRKLIVMDEPFKFVSHQRRESITELLNELSEEFNIQIIMVTHIQGLKCGKIIEL